MPAGRSAFKPHHPRRLSTEGRRSASCKWRNRYRVPPYAGLCGLNMVSRGGCSSPMTWVSGNSEIGASNFSFSLRYKRLHQSIAYACLFCNHFTHEQQAPLDVHSHRCQSDNRYAQVLCHREPADCLGCRTARKRRLAHQVHIGWRHPGTRTGRTRKRGQKVPGGTRARIF